MGEKYLILYQISVIIEIVLTLIRSSLMAKFERKKDDRINQIFEDLENYLEFCKDFGYKFDEADLYRQSSFPFRQFCKYVTGKPAKDMWAIDARN